MFVTSPILITFQATDANKKFRYVGKYSLVKCKVAIIMLGWLWLLMYFKCHHCYLIHCCYSISNKWPIDKENIILKVRWLPKVNIKYPFSSLLSFPHFQLLFSLSSPLLSLSFSIVIKNGTAVLLHQWRNGLSHVVQIFGFFHPGLCYSCISLHDIV